MGRCCWFLIWVVLLPVMLAGCATRQYSSVPAVAVTDACERQFLRWRNQVADEGRFDAQDWSPPGFPYLRVDRFLASFDVTELSPSQRRDWLSRAQAKAATAWRYEMQGGPEGAARWLDDLTDCADRATQVLASEPGYWPRLAEAAEVPDSYSTSARVFGLYPLVAPIVRWRATVTMTELGQAFEHYRPDADWREYRPAKASDDEPVSIDGFERDSLGIPLLGDEIRRALFQRYAPAWRIETRDRNDLPGIPGRSEEGRLTFRSEPVVYTQLGMTYQGGRVLPQLVYVLWFASRPSESWLDIYAGALDGFVWRVTLGENGQPLVYDTIHPCGCYHQWLLVGNGLRPNQAVEFEAEQLWLLGTVPGRIEAPMLSLSAGDHQLVGVDDRARHAATPGNTRNYRMEPLDGLRGRSHSGGRLYGGDGLVAGSERPERFLLWPTGVPSAGGMRQWGHHAVSFVGRRHFDDPFLLEQYFLSPP